MTLKKALDILGQRQRSLDVSAQSHRDEYEAIMIVTQEYGKDEEARSVFRHAAELLKKEKRHKQ